MRYGSWAALVASVALVAGEEGVLHTAQQDYCYMYNPNFEPLPSTAEAAKVVPIVVAEPVLACAALRGEGSRGTLVLVDRGG